MTFDDGVVTICEVVNDAEPGEIPVKRLKRLQELSFHEESVGITRYYEAIRANQLIEKLIAVPHEFDASVNQMAVLEDGSQYQIRMVQTGTDESLLKILRLSLERNGEEYEIGN